MICTRGALPSGEAVSMFLSGLRPGRRTLKLQQDAAQGPADVGLRKALSFSAVRNALQGIATEVHDAAKASKPDVLEVEFGFALRPEPVRAGPRRG